MNPLPTTKEQPSKSIAHVLDSGNAFTALRAAIEEAPEILSGALGTIIPGSLPLVRIVHAALKMNALKQIFVELEELRKKGAIDETFLKSDPAQACLADLLEAIDKTSPDPERLKAIKTAFLRVIQQGETGKSAAHAQEVLRMVYGLSAREIVVMATIHSMGSGGEVTAATWINDVANASGLMRSEIIEEIEHILTEKRLLFYRVMGTNGEGNHNRYGRIQHWGQKNRFTQLGLEVCQYILDLPA